MAPQATENTGVVEQFQYDEDILEEDDHTFTTLRDLTKVGYSVPSLQIFKHKDQVAVLLIAIVLVGIALRSLKAKFTNQEGIQKKTRSILSVVFIGVLAYVAVQSLNKQRKSL